MKKPSWLSFIDEREVSEQEVEYMTQLVSGVRDQI